MVSVSEASRGGELEALRALRDDLALKLDFMDALERISVLESEMPEREGSVLDELAKRRAARGARAAG